MSRRPGFGRVAAVVAIAAILVAAGAALLVRPALVFETVPALESVLVSLDPGLAVLALAAVLALLAPTLATSSRLRARRPRPLVTSDGASAVDRSGGTPAVGESVDRTIAAAIDYEGTTGVKRDEARQAVVEALRPVAASASARRTGRDRESAREAVATGAWTDDARAAAFLGDETGPSTPLSAWAYDLLTATDPFERALERTIGEVESLRDAPTGAGASSPETGTDPGSDDGSRSDSTPEVAA